MELEEYSDRKKIHLYRSLRTVPVKVPYLITNIREFRALLDPMIKNADKLLPSELIYLLREALDYDKFITDDNIPSPDDIKIANINQLQMASSKFKNIQSFLNYTETFHQNMSNDKNGVSLMTIHKSKGLEFPVVFVIGFVDGLLPNKNGEIEEERRVAFVGLSRAMKSLYVTYSQNYMG
ncbi:ATP-binding domain-containing protein, partial [bacterium]|nr:ATP-binding domain-containing protein [bacterium]